MSEAVRASFKKSPKSLLAIAKVLASMERRKYMTNIRPVDRVYGGDASTEKSNRIQAMISKYQAQMALLLKIAPIVEDDHVNISPDHMKDLALDAIKFGKDVLLWVEDAEKNDTYTILLPPNNKTMTEDELHAYENDCNTPKGYHRMDFVIESLQYSWNVTFGVKKPTLDNYSIAEELSYLREYCCLLYDIGYEAARPTKLDATNQPIVADMTFDEWIAYRNKKEAEKLIRNAGTPSRPMVISSPLAEEHTMSLLTTPPLAASRNRKRSLSATATPTATRTAAERSMNESSASSSSNTVVTSSSSTTTSVVMLPSAPIAGRAMATPSMIATPIAAPHSTSTTTGSITASIILLISAITSRMDAEKEEHRLKRGEEEERKQNIQDFLCSVRNSLKQSQTLAYFQEQCMELGLNIKDVSSDNHTTREIMKLNNAGKQKLLDALGPVASYGNKEVTRTLNHFQDKFRQFSGDKIT